MEELKKLLEEQHKAFADFRKANDERLAQMEKQGTSDPLLAEKVDRANAEITKLQGLIRELETKGNRLGAGGQPVDEAKAQHKAAFNQYIRKGTEDGLAELQQKAYSIGTDTAGGFEVPQDFDSALYEVELKWAPMRQAATVVSVSSEKYERIQNVHGGVAGWVAETGARAVNTNSAFGQFKPVFGELFSNWAASQRLLDDAALNLEGHITEEVGRQMAVTENLEFTTGAGSAGTSPKGILAYTPSASPTFGTNINLVKSGTSGTIVADTLLDVPPSILAGYRAGSVWMMAAATLATIRKLKDTANNYLVGPLTSAAPSQLLGFPILENEDVPAVAASANCIVFGNVKRGYIIADVKGTRILRDPYSNKPYVNFYVTKRVGGGVIDTSCLTAYQLAV